jgi:hypothetical protein
LHTHERVHTARYEHRVQSMYALSPASCTLYRNGKNLHATTLHQVLANVIQHACAPCCLSHTPLSQQVPCMARNCDRSKIRQYAPCAVLPLTPGGASVTSSSTKLGGSTLITCEPIGHTIPAGRQDQSSRHALALKLMLCLHVTACRHCLHQADT